MKKNFDMNFMLYLGLDEIGLIIFPMTVDVKGKYMFKVRSKNINSMY